MQGANLLGAPLDGSEIYGGQQRGHLCSQVGQGLAGLGGPLHPKPAGSSVRRLLPLGLFTVCGFGYKMLFTLEAQSLQKGGWP